MSRRDEEAVVAEGATMTDAQHSEAIYYALIALNKAIQIAIYQGGLRVDAIVSEELPTIGSTAGWRPGVPRIRVDISRPIKLSGAS